MIVTTSEVIVGKKIVKTLGLARGNTVHDTVALVRPDVAATSARGPRLRAGRGSVGFAREGRLARDDRPGEGDSP